MDPATVDTLKKHYKRFEGYRNRLLSMPEAYFGRYVGVVSSLTSPSDLILDAGCGMRNWQFDETDRRWRQERYWHRHFVGVPEGWSSQCSS